MINKLRIIISLVILILGLFLYSYFRVDTKDVDNLINNEDLVIASDLNIPWEFVFISDQDILVTERGGILKRLGLNNASIQINGVRHIGEGGLLGLALHPNFSVNNLIYLYLTSSDGYATINRVERYRLDLERNILEDRIVILDKIPGSIYHDGGRIAFGPDGFLYITTGDAGRPDLAQDTNSLAGKILRVSEDGRIPFDNPFNNPVFSYGHRNPQGLAWDEKGNLWSSEHGRSGLRSGFDEVNLIQKGKNYGWPEIEGDEIRDGMVGPIIHSGSDVTWAPAGMLVDDNTLLFSGLRGEGIYKGIIDGSSIKNLEKIIDDYGRIRSVKIYKNNLYFITSNRDGRGEARLNDDILVKSSVLY